MIQAFRSTRVVLPKGVAPAIIRVEKERVSAICGWGDDPAGAVLHDVGDAVILPGLVDTHVHINEPGRTEWEGFETASRAAAAGGVTMLVDMPLNCVPETVSADALQAKREAAHGKSWVDWAAWGGVVRENLEALPQLIAAGVPGLKCFLIDSGIDGFAWVDEVHLRLALGRLQGTGRPLLAHAEVPGPVLAATEALRHTNRDWRTYATYLASRPDASEVEAIALLIRLAEESRTPIHIVHLASAEALPQLADARQRGIPVSAETCAHYLWFAAEEIRDGATEYKCAPPIRSAANREALWDAIANGVIDMVTTDHSPCPPSMKSLATGRWDKAWGGIASLGLALPIVWTGMLERGFGSTEALARLAMWLSAAPARLAGIRGRKGTIHPGADADFAIFDPEFEWTITEAELHFRHKLSPYIGAKVRGRIRETWLRGACVYGAEGPCGKPRGQEWTRR